MQQRAKPDEPKGQPTMTRIVMASMAAVLLGCVSALAQVAPGTSPLGMTSPLGVGPALPVPPTRIPLGATELSSPGVSPMMSAAAGSATGTSPACTFGLGTSAMGTSTSTTGTMTGTSSATINSTGGTTASTTVFDGGGMAGTASGTCPVIGGSSSGAPAASASSPTMGSASTVARSGVPMGATELGVGGVSTLFTIPTTTLGSNSLSFPCTTTGTSSMTGTSSSTGTTSTTGTSS